jgi:hypothetical protein
MTTVSGEVSGADGSTSSFLPLRGEAAAGNVVSAELQGRQRLVELVYRGHVRLHGEGGAAVDVWQPERLGNGKHRVRLTVSFSIDMSQRYLKAGDPPLPDNPTSVLDEATDDIEVGSRLYDGFLFSVDGWGLYDNRGKRIRHHSRTFILRAVSRIELLVGDTGAILGAATVTRRNASRRR